MLAAVQLKAWQDGVDAAEETSDDASDGEESVEEDPEIDGEEGDDAVREEAEKKKDARWVTQAMDVRALHLSPTCTPRLTRRLTMVRATADF